MPDPVLVIAFFFHLIATIVWIGGLALLVLVVWPVGRQVLGDTPAYADLLAALRKRFTPLANLSLVVLIVTGMIQMGGDPNYDGLLVFDNDWSRAILLKHLAIIGMVIVGGVLQWGIAPAQERLALLRARDKATPEADQLARRERWLNSANLILGVAVLLLTAVATAI
ncbi:MAG: CopD family protein [Anaerolineae bacterium]|nr:CopD family protein [Anaerolineae bacterium]